MTQIVLVPDTELLVIVESNAVGPAGPQGVKGDNSVADIAFAFQGALLDGENLVGYVIAHAMTLSQADSIAKCVVAPNADVSMTLTKNGASMGTVTFLSGHTTGTVTLTSTSLVIGDVIAFIGPSPSNPTFSSITITLAGSLP